MVSRVSNVERDDDALFVKDGVPVKFCFHKSVKQGRGQITRDVERHGGEIVCDERHANVLLVDEEEDLAFIRRRYYSSTEVYRLSLYVEPRGFVQACIRSGDYCHVAPARQGMPGRARRGRMGRVSFTEEDRKHLAYYLATRFPTRDGRMGNSAYKDLVRLGETNDSSWEWTRRHTFHSWREHYKMNSVMMDARIDRYQRRLKDVGHHFGYDRRTHSHRDLRLEDEEDEEEEEDEDEEGEQRQGVERQDRRRQARDYLARHERDLVHLDEEEDDDIQEVVVQESQHAKRRGAHSDVHRQRDTQGTQAKRVRVTEASSNKRRVMGIEARRGQSSPMHEKDSDSDDSQEIEGSDLFGDRAYGDDSRSDDDSQDVDFPMSSSPRDGAPPSTQATLIASPAARQPTSAPGPTPTKVVEHQASTLRPSAPPSSQRTLVMTQERVERVRVRGAPVQPGPSVPRKTKPRGGAAAVAQPRARSCSVDPQHPRQPEDQGAGEKRKTKQKALVSIEEDVQVEEGPREAYAGVDVEPIVVTGGLPMGETLEDEIAVEGLLEASIGSGANEEDEEGEVAQSVHDDEDDSIEGGDEGAMPELPRYQDVGMENDPTDSDDAETHGSLVRGVAREGSVSANDAESDLSQDQEQEQDSDDEDAEVDRIERMANESLRAAPAPIPRARVTRSMAATQTRMQTQAYPQVTPHQTRSGSQAHGEIPPKTFPSPGTQARAVVDRFQEEERRIPYAPPEGSRAANAIKRRGRRA